jgi:hypothetical protein
MQQEIFADAVTAATDLEHGLQLAAVLLLPVSALLLLLVFLLLQVRGTLFIRVLQCHG